jgi:hypothetical protein
MPNRYQIGSLARAVDSDNTGIYVVGSMSELEMLPQWQYCIGWYKCDEGSGALLINSAPVGVANRLPNLDVYNAGTFWTAYSGFGTGGTNQYAYKNDTARTIYNNQTKMCFSRITGSGSTYNYLYRSDYAYQGGWQHIAHSNYGSGSRVDFAMANATSGVVSTFNQFLYDNVVNTWRFQFNYVAADGKQKMGVVNPDGTLTIGSTTSTDVSSVPTSSHTHFFAFRAWDGSNTRWGQFAGQMGDIIVYNSVLLSITEAAIWYDALRSKYSMAARSGW